MDKSDFIAIIEENKKLIYKVCSIYCQHAEERKDLEQEILYQLWKSFLRYDGRVKISTWIYRVALNTAITFYRKYKNRTFSNKRIDSSMITDTDRKDESEQNERLADLYKVINQLNELDKAIILLYLEDNKYREIGEILGITETNVATKINRIKKYLKNYFLNQKN